MRERHEMIFQGRVDSGAEEWICPTCGRRMLMQWTPNFDTLLLEHGDDTAIHSGAKGGLRLTDVEVTAEPAPARTGSETQWLQDNGIDWDGPSA
jgi:hypothetical protein